MFVVVCWSSPRKLVTVPFILTFQTQFDMSEFPLLEHSIIYLNSGGCGAPTLPAAENPSITLQPAPIISGSASLGSASLGSCSTVAFIKENPHVSGPLQLKPMLFKCQLYMFKQSNTVFGWSLFYKSRKELFWDFSVHESWETSLKKESWAQVFKRFVFHFWYFCLA